MIEQPTRVLFLASLLGLAGVQAPAAPTDQPPTSPGELFQPTRIWNVHLKFTPDQWGAMEPSGGPGGLFGGPPGPRARLSFGPGTLLAPVFLRDGDQNHDGKLSREEFQGLAGKWFTAWDRENAGKVNLEQLRTGLNRTFAPPGLPGRGPGQPGVRDLGMALQGPEGKRNGLASAMGIEFKYVHADLEFEGQTYTDVAVRYKGNGTFLESRGSLKRSLKVDLNKYVKGQKLAGITKLNLHNNVTDASWMNEVLSHRLYRDAGVPAPRTAYARVFVTVPGKFD
ncbi:MAG: CotH kinase family protein, partial [Verrucomicrobia bacterium]|nr:CotH kinase family protein [Verrucomicrobiota bacterium]